MEGCGIVELQEIVCAYSLILHRSATLGVPGSLAFFLFFGKLEPELWVTWHGAVGYLLLHQPEGKSKLTVVAE